MAAAKRHKYVGSDERVYTQYGDADAGTTLVVQPGESYAITAPKGLPVPPDDGRWAGSKQSNDEQQLQLSASDEPKGGEN